MLILGLNGGFRQGYQDVSACLVEDGAVLAAVEEERLSRIKFSAGRLPYLSVMEVLSIAGKSIREVDLVAFHGSTWSEDFNAKVRAYLEAHFGYSPKVRRFHHHDCHAASTFFASGFEKALVLTADLSGDGVSFQVGLGREDSVDVLERFDRPDSLGVFYSLITQYCGFTKDADEYKVMGLSAFGDRDRFDFDWLIRFGEGKLRLDKRYLVRIAPKAPAPHRDEMLYNDAFIRKMERGRRIPGSEIEGFYRDVAASAQAHLERTMLRIVQHYTEKTGFTDLCLAGGTALNCVMNQRIMNCGYVNRLFIQPASGDAGISLGAAWLAGLEHGVEPVPTKDTYLGKAYSHKEIKSILDGCRIQYSEVEDPAEEAVMRIAADQVIGWYQGRMEFGPRALGNRSILASALNPAMQDIVNRKIKLRESFRPFCPSVLEEDLERYFLGAQSASPFMTITYDVAEAARSVIAPVTHVDGTARIQTVNPSQNALFYRLLSRLKVITGHGIVMNTSFNLSHEPVVCSPRDALATFYSSGLDALIIGKFLIEK